ncbi:hypothetical protein HZB03_04645, partial [Candidatus Woesearchaeota archaeon]|nr:hypothetical protein [Candidatus Woesearchaeota archaeon]
LGLGLGFTKGMFAKFSSKLEVPPPNIPATPEEPIVIPQETIEVLKNKEFDFTVNYYNDFDDTELKPVLNCPNTAAFAPFINDPATGVQTSAQRVQPGSYKPFKFIMPKLQVTGKAICTIQFDASSGGTIVPVTKQIIIVSK